MCCVRVYRNVILVASATKRNRNKKAVLTQPHQICGTPNKISAPRMYVSTNVIPNRRLILFETEKNRFHDQSNPFFFYLLRLQDLQCCPSIRDTFFFKKSSAALHITAKDITDHRSIIADKDFMKRVQPELWIVTFGLTPTESSESGDVRGCEVSFGFFVRCWTSCRSEEFAYLGDSRWTLVWLEVGIFTCMGMRVGLGGFENH